MEGGSTSKTGLNIHLMPLTTEKAYLQAAAAGNEKAFKVLFSSYFPKLKGFINGLLQDPDEAEDIAQDIFVSLWLNRACLEEIDNLNAYLFHIAKNAAYRHIEHTLLFLDYLRTCQTDGSGKNETDGTEPHIYAKETASLISAYTEQMPAQRKRVYKMSREEGLNSTEIAEQLGIDKRTVENHLSKALSDLRKIINAFFCF